MNRENCALKLVDEIILYYDARSKKTSNYNKYNEKSASVSLLTRIIPRWTSEIYKTYKIFLNRIISSTNFNAQFYSLTVCLLHYYPRHVSSINMPIFMKKNCIHTASGIFALCKRLPSTLSPLSTSVLGRRLQRAKIPDAVWIQFLLLKMGMLMLETCRG